MSRLLIVSLSAFLAAPIAAQNASVGGPQLGLVHLPGAHEIRPILGIPGAAVLGQPSWTQVDAASIAPGGAWAWTSAAGQSTFLCGLAGSSPAACPVDGLLAAVDRLAWNRDGSAALLYSSSAGQLQRVRFSGGQPLADPALDISALGQVGALALDLSATRMVFGVAGSGFYLWDGQQAPVVLASTAQPGPAVFDGSGRLYAVDAAAMQIFEIDPGSAPAVFANLQQPDGTQFDPAALAVSNGGGRLLLADRNGPGLCIYDTASGSITGVIPLNFTPTRLDPLSSGPIFVLNGDKPSEWLLGVDAGDTPRVFFVPAPEQEQL
jgi:hypothetical protein